MMKKINDDDDNDQPDIKLLQNHKQILHPIPKVWFPPNATYAMYIYNATNVMHRTQMTQQLLLSLHAFLHSMHLLHTCLNHGSYYFAEFIFPNFSLTFQNKMNRFP